MLACVQAAFARAVFVWSWSLDVVRAGAQLHRMPRSRLVCACTSSIFVRTTAALFCWRYAARCDAAGANRDDLMASV